MCSKKSRYSLSRKNILWTHLQVTPAYKSSKYDKTHKSEVYECGSCGPETQVIKTEMPFVMVYLAAELACMNVKMQFNFSEKENERINVIEWIKLNIAFILCLLLAYRAIFESSYLHFLVQL